VRTALRITKHLSARSVYCAKRTMQIGGLFVLVDCAYSVRMLSLLVLKE